MHQYMLRFLHIVVFLAEGNNLKITVQKKKKQGLQSNAANFCYLFL